MSSIHPESGTPSSGSFVKLLGAEYDLVRHTAVLKRFYLSALLIITVTVLTSISIYYAIVLLFHSILFEILLSLFFSLLFVCIYIFLLNTFSKENRKHRNALNASNAIRIGFIAFMGFLIAQPLAILLHAAPLAADVENYKSKLLKNHSQKITALTKRELTNLTTQYRYYADQKDKFGTSFYNDQLHKIDSTLKSIRHKTAALEFAAYQTINNNSFFLYRVKKLNYSYPLSWLLSLLIILLFILPGYLVYSISSQDQYYQLKKARERKLVSDAYNCFAASYEKLFDRKITIFSRYKDPPFNSIRKQPPVAATMRDFVQNHLHGE